MHFTKTNGITQQFVAFRFGLTPGSKIASLSFLLKFFHFCRLGQSSREIRALTFPDPLRGVESDSLRSAVTDSEAYRGETEILVELYFKLTPQIFFCTCQLMSWFLVGYQISWCRQKLRPAMIQPFNFTQRRKSRRSELWQVLWTVRLATFLWRPHSLREIKEIHDYIVLILVGHIIY